MQNPITLTDQEMQAWSPASLNWVMLSCGRVNARSGLAGSQATDARSANAAATMEWSPTALKRGRLSSNETTSFEESARSHARLPIALTGWDRLKPWILSTESRICSKEARARSDSPLGTTTDSRI